MRFRFTAHSTRLPRKREKKLVCASYPKQRVCFQRVARAVRRFPGPVLLTIRSKTTTHRLSKVLSRTNDPRNLTRTKYDWSSCLFVEFRRSFPLVAANLPASWPVDLCVIWGLFADLAV